MDPTPSLQSSAARSLAGLTLAGGWVVQAIVAPHADATGGRFSVCYATTNASTDPPRNGFLKALDYSAAATHPNPPQLLQHLTTAYNYEKDLVARCADRNLSHVVRYLTAGEVTVDGFDPITRRVQYLIFEAGDKDARAALAAMQELDVAWAWRTIHNVANGVRQLHQVGISHQDVKPSNIVEFGDRRKVGDLGRSSLVGAPAPWDGAAVPGDVGYAPPEMLYSWAADDWLGGRRASDLYQIGSLILFMFTRVSLTPSLLGHLPPELHPASFGGSYRDVLPHLVAAFTHVEEELARALPDRKRDEVLVVFRELGYPDVSRRGGLQRVEAGSIQRSLERYVSKFDRLARDAEMHYRRPLR
jgi:eukaryotic-like serine/threonine-protein kinase